MGIMILTATDFKKVKCSIDMHGDRIIGYVSAGFLDSLNEFISQRVDIESLDVSINGALKNKVEELEKENSELHRHLESFQNNMKRVEETLKKFKYKKDN